MEANDFNEWAQFNLIKEDYNGYILPVKMMINFDLKDILLN